MDNFNRLRETIVSATKHLKKMPGSSCNDCIVYADNAMVYYDKETDAIWIEFNDETEDVELLSLHGSKLIKWALHIPALIERAKEFESEIRQKAEEASIGIQQAIDETTYHYK